MDLFKTVREVIYEKAPVDTLSDIEKAFGLIGNIQQIDRQAGNIQGRTKYGLNSVTIDAHVEPSDSKTKITFRGKSGDAAAVGAQKGIENLVDTMHNLDNPKFAPSKTGGIKPLQAIAVFLEISIIIFILFGLRSGLFSPGLMVFLIILFIILLLYLVLSRLRALKK
jgi:hypothetical protein